MTILGKLWGIVSGAATGGWATIISTVAQLAIVVAQAVRDRQLLNAGRTQATAEFASEQQERINEASRAADRASEHVDAHGVPDDFYRRD